MVLSVQGVFGQSNGKKNLAPRQKGARRILVMDDEKLMLVLIERMLSRLGYAAVTVPDGRTAVSAYKTALDKGERFDAVILDLTVPEGLSGLETMRLLKGIDPSVRGILSSGFDRNAELSKYEPYGFSGLLPKPYTLGELEAVLQSVFQG
ncbi:MAG: response regulator [Desulfovibrionales bacterium]